MQRSIDKVLSVQRPVVLAHIRGIRRRRPDARPEEVIRILERRFLAAVTTGGAAVGASAVIPAVGIGTSIALTGVETIGFPGGQRALRPVDRGDPRHPGRRPGTRPRAS